MEAKEKEILNELISGTKCQFVIPVFQRNYDWRVKDCEKLFDDIEDLAKDANSPDRKHFMGAFVCKFNKFVDTSFNQYILIDGQQRLTSITLLLKALHDYLKKFGDKYEEMRSEIKETYLINKFAKDSNLKLKLKPNQVDNDSFTKLMDDEDISGIETNIIRNYNKFYEWLGKMHVSIEDFYNALQRLEGVVVFLDDTDNPQVIFESLNSTGLELTDVDLIRNYLLMNLKADYQEKLYKDYWLKIEGLLQENFIQFIKDYLSFKNGIVTSSTKNYIYTAFQKYYRTLNVNKEEFLSNFYNMAKIYNRLYKFDNLKDDLSKALYDYSRLDIKTSYPFVFGLLIDNTADENGKKRISDKDLTAIIRTLESYLIRRNVCNLAGGGLSQVMASLYKDLVSKYGDKLYTDVVTKVASALASITTKAYFPKDDEFVRELVSRDMYNNRNILYILQKMELWKQGKEVVDLDSLSIEHIMPQTLSKEWIKYLNRPDWEEFHSSYKHKLGNLTLTAYNSEMSNKQYSEKKVHVDFSRLTLNKYFEKIDNWNQKEINDRADVLAKIAVQIWPYPSKVDMSDISTESHFLLDEEEGYDYTGTNPVGISFKNTDIRSNSWASLFIDTIKKLIDLEPQSTLSILYKYEDFGSTKSILSDVPSALRAPGKIKDDLYIETNYNTEFKVKILKEIFKKLQYDIIDIIVYIK